MPAPQRFDHEPELLLELFRFVARHGIRLSFETEQRIEARLPHLRTWFAEPRPLWPALRDLLAQPYAALALRAMHETGVLAAIFPELAGIECLALRDFYHRYTVDEHTLVAIQNLAALRREEEPPLRQYRDLLAETREPAVPLLALLFHDSGKAKLDENHIDVSVRLAETALPRVGAPAAERDTIVFLIRHHADLSIALQMRDIYDPQTAVDVAAQVGTVERLKALTLVTYSDISAVNPTVMTPWRAGQLWQLYLATYNQLTSGLETDRIEELPTGPPRRLAFIEGFPKRYLRTHSDDEIDLHVELEERSHKRGVAVEIAQFESDWRLTFVAADRPFLFASVAGTLASFRLNILRAEAFANKRGVVLDSFSFIDPSRNLELNPTEVERLRSTVERVVLGKVDVKELLKARPVPPPPTVKSRIGGRVAFNNRASGTATLVEIVAQDRPGLLYDLASAISSCGCNIEVVLIDTQAHKAIDVFYITRDGHKLTAEVTEKLGVVLRTACQTE